MNSLQIYLKERDLGWNEKVAQCAEKFTALEALRSSGFQLALSKLLIEELHIRCDLFRQHEGAEKDFEVFFETQNTGLRASFYSRFGLKVPGEEQIDLVREKFKELLSARTPPEKSLIGFGSVE